MKRVLRLLVSLAVRAWDLGEERLCRLTGGRQPARCVVLYYHSVPAHHRQLFARQMDLLLKLAQPIPASPCPSLVPGARYAAVTFDDGFLSVMEHAYPELKKRNIPWTIFIPSGRLGQPPTWLRHANGAARNDRVMLADELNVLAKDPLVAFGSHTVAHANLLEAGADQAKLELARSKAELESVLDRPIDSFSYPFGARNSALDRQARELGYRRLFSTDPEFVFQAPDQFLIGRMKVDPEDWPLEFRLKLLGAYRWQPAKRKLRNLIFS